MIKLTYIVCVYNSASTIIRTLKSIYRQPLSEEEFEVIVVDDCSPDNSSELVSSFALGHTNLQLVRQKQNHRVGTSMNLGIRMAKGEYIQVVDGDDIVGDEIVKTLNQCMEDKVDVSINTSQYEDSKGIMHPMIVETTLTFPMSANDFCEKVFNYDPIFGGTQFYMWSRDFLKKENHPFVEDLKMEDTDWIEYHLYKAKTIGRSRFLTYTYLYNENSQVHLMSATTTSDMILQCYRRLEGCKVYKDSLTNYVNVISCSCHSRVANALRYRYLSNFSYKDYVVMYERIGDLARNKLSVNSYHFWANMFLRHKYITLILLWCTVWMAHVGRYVVRFIRNLI